MKNDTANCPFCGREILEIDHLAELERLFEERKYYEVSALTGISPGQLANLRNHPEAFRMTEGIKRKIERAVNIVNQQRT